MTTLTLPQALARVTPLNNLSSTDRHVLSANAGLLILRWHEELPLAHLKTHAHVVVNGMMRSEHPVQPLRRVCFRYFTAGQWLGAESILGQAPLAGLRLKACGTTTLLVLQLSAVQDLLRRNSALQFSMMRDLVAQHRESVDLIRALATMSLRDRLFSYVRYWSDKAATCDVPPQPPSMVEMAGFVGTRRETLLRCISKLQSERQWPVPAGWPGTRRSGQGAAPL